MKKFKIKILEIPLSSVSNPHNARLYEKIIINENKELFLIVGHNDKYILIVPLDEGTINENSTFRIIGSIFITGNPQY